MNGAKFLWLMGATLVGVAVLATLWKFGLEPIADPFLPGEHSDETPGEQWEFVIVCVLLAAASLVLPLVLGLRAVAAQAAAEARIRELAQFPEQSPFPVLRLSGAAAVQYANRAAQPLLDGWGVGVGAAVPGLVDATTTVLAEGQQREVALQLGERHWLLRLWPYRGHVNVIAQDVTDAHRVEQAQRLAAVVFENANEAIMVTAEDKTILAVNPAYTRLTGFEPGDIVGKRPDVLKSGRHDHEFYRAMQQALARAGEWSGEIWNRRKDGQLYLAWLSITTVKDSGGRIAKMVGISNDITERKQEQERIVHQATHDALTGLPNRMLFHDRLEQALTAGRRRGLRAALMFVDLDRFKAVNDTHGHGAGDLLLQQVAERLRECVREEDTVARLAGDEFTVILPSIRKADDAELVAEKILDRLTQPFDLAGTVVTIGGSIGIALFPDHAGDPPLLIACADQAMYAAKKAGRGCYAVYAQTMPELVQ